jgi:hypothetical protein
MGMRMHIVLDDEVTKEIDEIAGPRGRSKFIREAIEAKVDVDRRLASRRRLIGSMPDFAPWMTPEWIGETRKREGEAREAQLAEHWRREG